LGLFLSNFPKANHSYLPLFGVTTKNKYAHFKVCVYVSCGGAAGTCTPVLRRSDALSTYLVYLLFLPHTRR